MVIARLVERNTAYGQIKFDVSGGNGGNGGDGGEAGKELVIE
jgi:NAD(P)H-hydrate repair Nnr-like enzyme with NAD(P)H-hydrate epimerase domain